MGIRIMDFEGGEHSQFRNMGRVAFNELRNHLGEPLQSVNLDDFFEIVWPYEEDRPFTIDVESSSSRAAEGAALHHVGRVTLVEDISKRREGKARRNIFKGKKNHDSSKGSAKRIQPTLEGMTLEDFLDKAGAVTDEQGMSHASGDHRLQQYGFDACLQSSWQRQERMGTYVSRSSATQQVNVGIGRKMDPGEMTEKKVEKRQKRMIKNRESAARSRARKQAYTNELENKILRLEEENERLKKEKEMDDLLYLTLPPEPMSRLRRESSAPL